MPRFAYRLLTAIAVVAAPAGAAQAAELSTTSSSGSMNIVVNIPPIGPALRAQASGAVGLWTIEGQFDGLMVQTGSTGSAPLTLYTRPGNLVGVSLGGAQWSPASLVSPQSASNDAGLIRSTYDVGTNPAQVVTFVGL